MLLLPLYQKNLNKTWEILPSTFIESLQEVNEGGTLNLLNLTSSSQTP